MWGSTRKLVAIGAVAVLASTALPANAADRSDRFTAQPLTPTETIVGDLSKAARLPDGRVSVIVQLEDPSVATYSGGTNGFAPTSPDTTGKSRLDLDDPATRAYRGYLSGKHRDFNRAVKEQVRDAKVTSNVDIVLNSASVILPPEKVPALAAVPGVAHIYPDTLRTLDTDASPAFIGATSAWQSLGGQQSAGEGVVVAILDSGIWPEHPSFSDPDPSGKPYPAPRPANDGSRECQFSGGANPGAAFTCNNKLIAATRLMSTYDAVVGLAPGEFTSARDDDGHGTHTASTSAGNGAVAASVFGVPRGTVSGIAPRAQVEAFKVCGEQGCFSSDSVAAVQAAVADGVDVINFSISGGASPYSDPVEMAFLEAYDAGVFVAASAGNSGPGPDTTDHRGPWVTTVAASTHNRAFTNTVDVVSTDGATLSLSGTSATNGVGPAPVVVPSDPACGPAPAGTYAGQIVVCRRGGTGRAEKGSNVLAAGGVGMILYNQSDAVTDLETDNHYLPTSHVQFAAGNELLAFLAAHPNVTATISAGAKSVATGDVMASFSSRGGPGQSLGISKPDITAPGVQILAGHSPEHVGVAGGPQGELFQAIAGTSMSSPHIAGAGALIKALHPTWTPGQIKSALMTTARTKDLVKEDGVTPFDAFDAGSGRVDLNVAGNPGLTFAATGEEFRNLAASLYLANYPSIYHPNMPGIVTVKRTATSVLTKTSTWKLKVDSDPDFRVSVPRTITVAPGGSVTFPVRLDASAVPLDQTRFARITLTQLNGGGRRVLTMPVTIVRGQAAVTFSKTCTPTDLTVGGTTDCTLTATNPTAADVTYQIRDALPKSLDLVRGSVVGGQSRRNTVTATGTVPAAQPATATIDVGETPAGGYLPLSSFGIAPISGVGDETITNFNVPEFKYGGQTWTRIGVVSNGYVVVGGGTASDVNFVNQALPDPAAPNNVIAGFWTDLNPGDGGAMRVGVLGDGVDSWLVFEWENVPEYSTPAKTHSFQVWIGVGTDAHPDQDTTIAYGPSLGNGDGGFATVGAENSAGSRGQNYYLNGTGTLPTEQTQLRVSSTPGSTASAVVSYRARADRRLGPWTNCATLESSGFLGTSYSCVSGTILY